MKFGRRAGQRAWLTQHEQTDEGHHPNDSDDDRGGDPGEPTDHLSSLTAGVVDVPVA
jgi:hypothetical protein